MSRNQLISTTMAAALVVGLTASASAQEMIVGLITKTDTNPFFVKMKEGAEAKAEELGMDLRAYAGRYDGDNETQVAAIETCIANGAKGILLTPSDPAAIAPVVEQARDAGEHPSEQVPAAVAGASFHSSSPQGG